MAANGLAVEGSRVEGVPQPVTHKVDAQDRDQDHEAREEGVVAGLPDELLGPEEHAAPGGQRRPDPEVQVADRALRQDGGSDIKGGRHQDRAEGVGDHVAEDDLAVSRAHRPGGFDEFLLLDGEHHGADDSGRIRPQRQANGQHHHGGRHGPAEGGGDQDQQEDLGDGQHGIGDPHQEVIHDRSEIAGHRSNGAAQQDGDHHAEEADHARDLASLQNATEDVTTKLVGPHDVGAGVSDRPVEQDRGMTVDVRGEGGQDAGDDERRQRQEDQDPGADHGHPVPAQPAPDQLVVPNLTGDVVVGLRLGNGGGLDDFWSLARGRINHRPYLLSILDPRIGPPIGHIGNQVSEHHQHGEQDQHTYQDLDVGLLSGVPEEPAHPGPGEHLLRDEGAYEELWDLDPHQGAKGQQGIAEAVAENDAALGQALR